MEAQKSVGQDLWQNASHYVVSMVSQFMHSPSSKHFDAVNKILKYLKGTLGRVLLFKKHEHLHVEVHNHVDWAGV